MLFVQIFDLFTLFLISFWLIKMFLRRDLCSKFFISSLLYVFYIVPLGLDWLYEMADYSYSGWWGFMVPRGDVLTNVLYDILFLYTFFVFLIKNRYQVSKVFSNNYDVQIDKMYLYLSLIAILPPIAVIFLMRQPTMLFAFQWRELEIFSTGGSYATIEKITYLAVSCSVLLLFSKNRFNILVKFFSVACLVMNICIQGKRAILFYAIINIVIVLYLKFRNAQINLKKTLFWGIVSLLICIVFLSFMVNMTMAVKLDRGYDPNNTSAMYTTTRIDFLRDDRVRLSIYSSIHPDVVEVLHYPAQSYLTDVFSFIPLNYLASMFGIHLYSYQTYFTHALERKKSDMSVDVANRSYMTVCFVSELISNVGLIFAIFILPYLCLWFAKLADKYPYPLNALILCIFASLNMFDFTYMAYYIEAVIVLCWLFRRSRKSIRYIGK